MTMTKLAAWKLEPFFTLRPFQVECLRKQSQAIHSLIADDMGLGKTVEAIALDRYRRIVTKNTTAKTLIIAPLSVVNVWVSHYRWMLPNMKVIAYDGEGKMPPKARATFLQQVEQADADVYVCHWDAVRLMPELAQRQWFHVIADEAHRAKNRKSQQTIALKKIKSKHRTACTGTPAETRPDDLWSVLNWLYPSKFSSYWSFRKRHVATENFNGYPKIVGVMNIPELLRAIEPFYTRRLKEDVLKELPAKTYSEIMVTLTPKQRREYDSMKKGMLSWVGEHEDQPLAAPAVIAQLRRLQQFAISSIVMVDGFKTVTVDTPQAVIRWNVRVERHNVDNPDSPEPFIELGHKYKVKIKVAKMVEPSSKLDAVMQLIEDNPNESFVIFSQFKQAIAMLGARLEKAKVSHGIYTGDTSKNDRDQMVDDFQAGKLRVFAGTIRAGGEGITLTRSRTIVFIDRDWSPSRNRQAEDRLHRMGQTNVVQVIDIVAGSTVDRGRLQKIEQTWQWLRELLGDK